jgi:hypothetical protein
MISRPTLGKRSTRSNFNENRCGQVAQAREQADKRTRLAVWGGLTAMGFQFGLLARLTFWEYSWDIGMAALPAHAEARHWWPCMCRVTVIRAVQWSR